MRVMLLAGMVATAAASWRSCGNCIVGGEFDGRCNTGPVDLIPYNVSDSVPTGDLNGTNPAEAVTIAEISSTVGEAWKTMFCATYLARYKDGYGSLAGEGAACVRAFTKEAILAADKDARSQYVKFGTENGYASSFAVHKGISKNMEIYGVDGTGDVPANWCGMYMREMLCAVAFPQVVMAKDELAAERVSGPFNALSKSSELHYIRAVSQDSCETLFDVCNRREPTSDETKTTYQPEELEGYRAQVLLSNNTRRKMKSDAWCGMWKEGYGLSSAGTGVDKGTLVLEYEGSSAVTYSLIAAAAAVILAVL